MHYQDCPVLSLNWDSVCQSNLRSVEIAYHVAFSFAVRRAWKYFIASGNQHLLVGPKSELECGLKRWVTRSYTIVVNLEEDFRTSIDKPFPGPAERHEVF